MNPIISIVLALGLASGLVASQLHQKKEIAVVKSETLQTVRDTEQSLCNTEVKDMSLSFYFFEN